MRKQVSRVRGMVERLLPALGVWSTLRKQRNRFDSGEVRFHLHLTEFFGV